MKKWVIVGVSACMLALTPGIHFGQFASMVSVQSLAGAQSEGTSTAEGAQVTTSSQQSAFLVLTSPAIALPVAQAREEAPTFYLTHTLEGSESICGTPFFDWRTSESSQHRIIYGHHMWPTHLVFSDISDAYTQPAFEKIGALTLTEVDGSKHTYIPFCASRVPENYQLIQAFSFATHERFEEWLGQVAQEANANAQGIDTSQVKSAITLCTCSEIQAGQPFRTLLTFVEV